MNRIFSGCHEAGDRCKGKTTVMAMLIAWQTLNAVRAAFEPLLARLSDRPDAGHHDPGSRLRVLLPGDADCFYEAPNLVPVI
ncbi:MAG: hypothetical protein M5U35_17170 [Roseovarius sp.]|nr:hypothetical protein [Roseovarius sp.]